VSEEIQRLWRLHDLDERAATARAALAKYPEQKRALDGRVESERARLMTHGKTAEEALKARRKLEQDIEGVTAQQRQFESRQPSVKTNDEFRALTLEIDGCKAKRSDLETQVLMRLEEEESLAKQKPGIDRALKDAETERAERLRDIEREEGAAKASLEAIEAARTAELAELTPLVRQRYERIHASRDGRAVVPIVKNACGGCFRAQPPQMLQEIRRGERLLVCDGCGRIIVLPPDEVPAG
jgi:hypothetical protein